MRRILITNDDGADSWTLGKTVSLAKEFGEVFICVPNVNRSSLSRSHDASNIPIKPTVCGKIAGVPIHVITGTPAQAAMAGLLQVGKGCIDLCIAGINDGLNIGQSFTLSGTIGAALEATSHGIPAIAVSTGDPADALGQTPSKFRDIALDRTVAALRRVVASNVNGGWPPECCMLNLNVPTGVKSSSEPVWTTVSSKNFYEVAEVVEGVPKFEIDHSLAEFNSDIFVVCKSNMISISAVHARVIETVLPDKRSLV